MLLRGSGVTLRGEDFCAAMNNSGAGKGFDIYAAKDRWRAVASAVAVVVVVVVVVVVTVDNVVVDDVVVGDYFVGEFDVVLF